MKCPHCKQELEPTPLQALKLHLESRITILTAQKKMMEDREFEEHRIQAHQHNIAKWQSWLKAVNGLEANQENLN